MPASTIYYIRHGETSWNAQGRLQGTQDIALNDLGRRQAAHAGNVRGALTPSIVATLDATASRVIGSSSTSKTLFPSSSEKSNAAASESSEAAFANPEVGRRHARDGRQHTNGDHAPRRAVPNSQIGNQ